jgi:hypothetical protein
MRPKCLSVHRNYIILECFLYEVILEYTKIILACMENMIREYKHIMRIRQEYLPVYGEYANRHNIDPISANIRPKNNHKK